MVSEFWLEALLPIYNCFSYFCAKGQRARVVSINNIFPIFQNSEKAEMFEACVPVEWFEWFECALCGRCGWGGCNSCPPPLPSPPPTRLTIEADVPVLQLFSLLRPEGPRSPRGDKGSALTLCMPPPPGRPAWPPGEQWGGGGVLVDILSWGILKC